MNRPAVLPLNAAGIRLGRLAALTDGERADLAEEAAHPRVTPARRELLAEGEPIRHPALLLAGWACRVRDLPDGRRQILDFVLPGEPIGLSPHPEPRALASIVSLTEVTTCRAPRAMPGSRLADAYAVSAAASESAMLRQIVRLGRLSALQRTADLLLELHERLSLSDVAQPTSFPLPLTQETLADALGLTSVHVNRTLKVLRNEGLVTLGGGKAGIPRPDDLRALVQFRGNDAAGVW